MSQFKTDRDKTMYDRMLLSRNSGILEHTVLLGIIKSFKFYTSIKRRLCPKVTGELFFRPDFTRIDFNQVYTVAAHFWETLGNNVPTKDMGINGDLMELLLAKRAENGAMTADEANAINNWLKADIQAIDLEPELLTALPNNPLFCNWLAGRAIAYEQNKLATMGMIPTVADMEAALTNVRQSATPDAPTINTSEVLLGEMKFSIPVRTLTLSKLDDALGGGCRYGETYVCGGISGGGKTILAMQLAKEYVMQGLNTVVLTTERPPWSLLMRVVSNHLDMDFGTFNKRVVDAGKGSQLYETTIKFIPPEVWEDAKRYPAASELVFKTHDHLKFIDWSTGSKSLVQDFDSAVDQLINQNHGWAPQVIIVDWVGGGLDTNSYRGDQLRHFYKMAGETIVNHGKRTKRVMWMNGQLSKILVKPSTTYISMDMMAECKSLVDNCSGFVGITALRETEKTMDENMSRIKPFQFLCVDKSTWGTGGKVRVRAAFEYQRFEIQKGQMQGGT